MPIQFASGIWPVCGNPVRAPYGDSVPALCGCPMSHDVTAEGVYFVYCPGHLDKAYYGKGLVLEAPLAERRFLAAIPSYRAREVKLLARRTRRTASQPHA